MLWRQSEERWTIDTMNVFASYSKINNTRISLVSWPKIAWPMTKGTSESLIISLAHWQQEFISSLWAKARKTRLRSFSFPAGVVDAAQGVSRGAFVLLGSISLVCWLFCRNSPHLLLVFRRVVSWFCVAVASERCSKSNQITERLPIMYKFTWFIVVSNIGLLCFPNTIIRCLTCLWQTWPIIGPLN